MGRFLVKTAAAALCAAMMLGSIASFGMAMEVMGVAETAKSIEGDPINNDDIITKCNKALIFNNPISSEVFCADPTAIEHEGRLYVIGTNDHQQYELKGSEVDNTYECIKSFVIFSTEDMVNWTYHGIIDVGRIAPWIMNAWAPSIVKRVEADGLTHFYLYFSNSGMGVGVITTTDLLGEWEDPLGRALISVNTPGLKDCPTPFDPGAVIDDKGVGWLSFGAGKAPNGTDYMPGSARIVRLGEDMISFASDFAVIPAPYLFEASELNYFNGTFVYTYNTDWSNHALRWEYECRAPSVCSMVYMTSTDPLNSESWVVRGEYFKNPGLSGLEYSNNHTHVEKFKGQYYIFHHTLLLKSGMRMKGSYRSIGVDTLEVDEENIAFSLTGASRKGIITSEGLSAFAVHAAAELNNTVGASTNYNDRKNPVVDYHMTGSWISVRNVVFTESEDEEGTNPENALNALSFLANVKGRGRLEVRLDEPTGTMLAAVSFDCEDFTPIIGDVTEAVGGTHDLYFVASGDGITFARWMFAVNEGISLTEQEPEAVPTASEGTGPDASNRATGDNSPGEGRKSILLYGGFAAIIAAVAAAVLIKTQKRRKPR